MTQFPDKETQTAAEQKAFATGREVGYAEGKAASAPPTTTGNKFLDAVFKSARTPENLWQDGWQAGWQEGATSCTANQRTQ
jgi:hypothetical protein